MATTACGRYTLIAVAPALVLIALSLAEKPVFSREDFDITTKIPCTITVHGRYLISDDNGYVCSAFSIDPWTRCCPQLGDRYLCSGCNLDSQCCNSYEYCVSCCLDPSKTKEEFAKKVKKAKPVTAGTYASLFDFCSGRCRHSSASVVHENAYASEFHHCFSLNVNLTERIGSNYEGSLAGINIIVGRQGESCNSVCQSKGQSCVGSKLSVLNRCELLQKYMRCRKGCFMSFAGDQPAEFVDNAPNHLNPGACLYTKMDAMLSCDGSHRYTKRICPCA